MQTILEKALRACDRSIEFQWKQISQSVTFSDFKLLAPAFHHLTMRLKLKQYLEKELGRRSGKKQSIQRFKLTKRIRLEE